MERINFKELEGFFILSNDSIDRSTIECLS
jgi:hypothetical protein